MNQDLMKAQDILLSKVNQICGKFGLNNVMAQLYAVLYLNGGPMSLNDMVDRLKISKGSVSINIRALERYGAVRQIWIKGSRKDYYEAEPDIAKVIIERAKSMVSHRMSEIDDMMNSSYALIDSVGGQTGTDDESVRIFKERLEKLKDVYDKSKSIFGLFNTVFASSAFAAASGEIKAEK